MGRAVGSGVSGAARTAKGGAAALLALGAGLAVDAGRVAGAGSHGTAASGSRAPYQSGADTVRVPRAGESPTLDCRIGEWPARGRLHLKPDLPTVVVRGEAEGAGDMTVRLELQWSPDTLWVMADVEDDSVEGGLARGGDWIQLGVDASALWIAAPGEAGPAARLGTRATGHPVPRERVSSCRTDYGWTAEVALTAGEMANDPALGAVYGLGLFAEDDDGEAPGVRRTVMWRETPAFLGPAPSEPEDAPALLDRLRRDTVTLEEIAGRPGARDTAVDREGRKLPAVRFPLEGGMVTAFAPTRTSTAVTYRIDRSEIGLLRRLGLAGSRAQLELRFGDLQTVQREETLVRSPRFRLDLLPGVVVEFFPATPGEMGEPPAAQRPERVYIRSGGRSSPRSGGQSGGGEVPSDRRLR